MNYPVPDDMLDIVKQVLKTAGIEPKQRTSELTVAILQLIASRRGIAALPWWAVAAYLEKRYVSARPIVAHNGEFLAGELYATALPALSAQPYMREFVSIMRATSLVNLPAIELL